MMTVLIVEDEESVAELWRRLLLPVARDEKIRIARTAEEALEKMAIPPPPELVLLDIRVPGLNSGEPDNMLYHIRDLKALNPGATVLVLTGVSDESLPALARQLGADGFSQKTSAASQDRLYGAICSALGSKKEGEPAYSRSVELLELLSTFLTPEAPSVPPVAN